MGEKSNFRAMFLIRYCTQCVLHTQKYDILFCWIHKRATETYVIYMIFQKYKRYSLCVSVFVGNKCIFFLFLIYIQMCFATSEERYIALFFSSQTIEGRNCTMDIWFNSYICSEFYYLISVQWQNYLFSHFCTRILCHFMYGNNLVQFGFSSCPFILALPTTTDDYLCISCVNFSLLLI